MSPSSFIGRKSAIFRSVYAKRDSYVQGTKCRNSGHNKKGKVCTLFLLCFPSLCMLQNLVREWLVWTKVWKNLKEVF